MFPLFIACPVEGELVVFTLSHSLEAVVMCLVTVLELKKGLYLKD